MENGRLSPNLTGPAPGTVMCLQDENRSNEPGIGISANKFPSKKGTHYSQNHISEFMKVKLQQLRIMPFLRQVNRSSKYCQTKSQVKFHEQAYHVTRNAHRCGETLTGTGPLLNVLCLITVKGLIHPSSTLSVHKCLPSTGPCVKCLGRKVSVPA